MTKAQISEATLLSEGWEYDHTAMSRGYHSAGRIDTMKDKNGFHYVRVYTSECKRNYQVTWVYRKAI